MADFCTPTGVPPIEPPLPPIDSEVEILCDVATNTCVEIIKKIDACTGELVEIAAYTLAGDPITVPAELASCSESWHSQLMCDTTVLPATPVVVYHHIGCGGAIIPADTYATLLSGALYAGPIALLSNSCTELVGSVLCEIDATGALINQWFVVARYSENGGFLSFEYRNLATGALGTPDPTLLRYCDVDSDHEQVILHDCVAGVCTEFLRHYYYRNGLLLSTFDTLLDGITAYTAVAGSLAGPCPEPDRKVELVYDVLPDGTCVSVELVKTFNCSGTASVAYLDLAGLPYTVVGTISTDCPCEPLPFLGIITDLDLLGGSVVAPPTPTPGIGNLKWDGIAVVGQSGFGAEFATSADVDAIIASCGVGGNVTFTGVDSGNGITYTMTARINSDTSGSTNMDLTVVTATSPMDGTNPSGSFTWLCV